MAKKKTQKKTTKKPQSKQVSQSFLSTLSTLQKSAIALGIIILVIVIYFKPMSVDGLSPTGVDVVGSTGGTNQIKEFQEETGKTAYWNPNIFSGMPIYHRLPSNTWTIKNFFSFFYDTKGRDMVFHYLLGAIGMFVLARLWGIPVFGAFLAGFAFALMPAFEVSIQAGHFQKMRAIVLIPWVVAAFEYFVKKLNLLSVVLFIIAFSTQIQSMHYQIIYYTVILLFVLGLRYIVSFIREKSYKPLLLRFGVLAIAIILSIAAGLNSLWTTWEYAPYSIRGGSSDGSSAGLDYNYATSWSLAPKEMYRLLVPNAFGGASNQYYSGDAVPQLKGRTIPGYWGEMPFTEGGEYIGIITCFLALLAVAQGFREKNHLIIYLSGFLVLAFLVSFGRHLSFVYDLLFNLLPMFNKFRIPSMFLFPVFFTMAILAGFGLKYLFDAKTDDKNFLFKVSLGIGAFLILMGVFPHLFEDAFALTKGGENLDMQVMPLVMKARYDLLTSDANRLILFAIGTSAVVLLYLKGQIKIVLASTALCGLLLIDLLGINTRYLTNLVETESFETSHFRKTETDKLLLGDNSLFRIFNVSQRTFTDNDWSYYHQSAGGYSPAKLRIYQDLIESCFFKGADPKLPINWNIINMLNVKYLIFPQELQYPNLEHFSTDKELNVHTYENKNVLPRAFIVGTYEVISEKQARLRRLNEPAFNPAETAILETEPGHSIEPPDSSRAEITHFDPNKIELSVFTDSDALLVLSEIYYPEGWTATIDGEESKIFKTNHVLRSVFVPAGEHEIKFAFAPVSYVWGSRVQTTVNAIVYLTLFGLLIIPRVRKKTP